MISGLIALAALLVFVFLGPPTERGGNRSSNHGFGIRLRHPADSEADGQSPSGVRAQEIGEFRLAWVVGMLLALPALLLDGWLVGPIYLIGAALGQSLFRVVFKPFDYVGHGVEIIVAEEEGREGYRAAEIDRMINRDTSRKGMTPAEVDAILRKWDWLSKLVRRLV